MNINQKIPSFAIDTPILVALYDITHDEELNILKSKTLKQKGEYKPLLKLFNAMRDGKVNLVLPPEVVALLFRNAKKIGMYNMIPFVEENNFVTLDLSQNLENRKLFFDNVKNLAEDYMAGLSGREIANLAKRTGKDQSNFYSTPFEFINKLNEDISVSHQAYTVAEAVEMNLPLITSSEISFSQENGRKIIQTINKRNSKGDFCPINVCDAEKLYDTALETQLPYPNINKKYAYTTTKEYVKNLKQKVNDFNEQKTNNYLYFE